MSLKFKFSKHNDVVKEFSATVASLEEYSEYRKSLKTLQKDVNEYLTSLVGQESTLTEPEKEYDLLDSDSEEDKAPKRSSSGDRTSKKTKVKIC